MSTGAKTLHGEADTLDKGTELRTQPKEGGYTGHGVGRPSPYLAARCAWCRPADDLITGGLCPWAPAPLPGSSAWTGGRLHAPPPPTRLLATCSQAWANSEGLGALIRPGNDAMRGWPWGAARADPSRAGLKGLPPRLARASP